MSSLDFSRSSSSSSSSSSTSSPPRCQRVRHLSALALSFDTDSPQRESALPSLSSLPRPPCTLPTRQQLCEVFRRERCKTINKTHDNTERDVITEFAPTLLSELAIVVDNNSATLVDLTSAYNISGLLFGGGCLKAAQQLTRDGDVLMFYDHSARLWSADLCECKWVYEAPYCAWSWAFPLHSSAATRAVLPPTAQCSYWRLVLATLHGHDMVVVRVGDFEDEGCVVKCVNGNNKFVACFVVNGRLYAVEEGQNGVYRVDLDCCTQEKIPGLTLRNPLDVTAVVANTIAYLDDTGNVATHNLVGGKSEWFRSFSPLDECRKLPRYTTVVMLENVLVSVRDKELHLYCFGRKINKVRLTKEELTVLSVTSLNGHTLIAMARCGRRVLLITYDTKRNAMHEIVLNDNAAYTHRHLSVLRYKQTAKLLA